MRVLTIFYLLLCSLFATAVQAQFYKPKYIGIAAGAGNEIKNTDYSYSNRTLKLEAFFQVHHTEKWSYEVLIQPEMNFAKHQLLNLFFVTPDEPNFEELRDRYTKLKDIREYALGIGFIARRHLSKKFDVYGYLSVGPMYTDTQTERLSRGFAFADVFAVGLSYHVKNLRFDIRPNFRHTSNAGLQSSNAGFNTLNCDFAVAFKIQ